jgi:ketosteroid isomerase-like protein
MDPKLPEPLASYYAAVNARDNERVLALFTEAAVVADEREEHRGRVAIRSWMQGTATKYGPINVEPKDHAERGGTTVVTCTVSGDFRGSPATLRYTFTLEHQSIARLTIA